MTDALLHAIDLASIRDWDAAKGILERSNDPIGGRLLLLFCDLEQQERSRARRAARVRHEIGNALTIAKANVEGIVDKILEATPERLERVLEALSSAALVLEGLGADADAEGAEPDEVTRLETFNICALIAAHVAAIEGFAKGKRVAINCDLSAKLLSESVAFRGDSVQIGQILRNVLINAVRYAPPGGSVEIHYDRLGSELTLTILDSGRSTARFIISLPAIPLPPD